MPKAKGWLRNLENIICIAGKNQIAVDATKYLLEEARVDKQFIRIITNNSDIGIDTWQPSLKKYALENNIQIITLEKAYEIKNLIFISLEFDKIIKPKKMKTSYLYNMHFSLLPKYKGMYTSTMPLINGENKSGVTFHLIDEGIDTGDIIAQREFDIDIFDTARDLYFKNLKHSFALFKSVIKNILNKNIRAKRQNHIGASYYSQKAIDFKNISINFNKTSFEIHNQIRAFIFPEYQLPKIDDKEIHKCILTSEKIKQRKIIEKDKYIISGIDGFKIIAYTSNANSIMGGGDYLLNLLHCIFVILFKLSLIQFLKFQIIKTSLILIQTLRLKQVIGKVA